MGTALKDRRRAGAAEAAGALEHPQRNELVLSVVLHALSDPVRLEIVCGLSGGDERSCKSFDLPVVKSTCTHHFKVLREAGVIHQRLDGTTKMSKLRREDLDTRFPGLLEAVIAAGPK